MLVFVIGMIPQLDFPKPETIDPTVRWFSRRHPAVRRDPVCPRRIAIWFFLAIEGVPLAAEESATPPATCPGGTIVGMLPRSSFAGVLDPLPALGVEPGSKTLAENEEPLLEGCRRSLRSGTSASILGLVAVAGLVASFHTIIFAYGRNSSRSRGRATYPHPLSVTGGQRQTPHVALLLGAVLGWGAAYIIWKNSESDLGASLLITSRSSVPSSPT